MDGDKKSWLYAGLALAAGVGLVSLLTQPADAGQAGVPPYPEGPAGSKPRLGQGARVLLVGDSLAVGLGPPFKQVAATRGIGVAHDGKSGTTASQWANGPSLPVDLGRDKFDVVLVSLGTNDMASNFTADQIQRSMQAIVDKIQASGARAAWVAPPRMVTLKEAATRAAIANIGVPVFPSDALDIPRGGDQIHPTAMGYAGWAGALLSWLTS